MIPLFSTPTFINDSTPIILKAKYFHCKYYYCLFQWHAFARPNLQIWCIGANLFFSPGTFPTEICLNTSPGNYFVCEKCIWLWHADMSTRIPYGPKCKCSCLSVGKHVCNEMHERKVYINFKSEYKTIQNHLISQNTLHMLPVSTVKSNVCSCASGPCRLTVLSLIKGCLYLVLSKRCSTEHGGIEECRDGGEGKRERERLSR